MAENNKSMDKGRKLLIGFIIVLLLNKIYFPRKNRKNQTVMFLFMPVIRPELSMDLNILPRIILRYIQKPF